jgi:hypothetical protein
MVLQRPIETIVKRDEWLLHSRGVSAWERDYYLATN